MNYTTQNKETIYKGKDKEGVLKNFWVDDHSIITLEQDLTHSERSQILHKFKNKNGTCSFETTNASPFKCEGLKIEFTMVEQSNKIIVRPDLFLLFHKGFTSQYVLEKATEHLMKLIDQTLKETLAPQDSSIEPTGIEVIVLNKPLTKAQFNYFKENGGDECEGKCFSYKTGTEGPFNCEGLTMSYEFNEDNSMITVSPDSFAQTSSGMNEKEILSYLKRQILTHVNYHVDEHAKSVKRTKLKN